ncbi:MAG: M12 family metallo-peptidase, partial [Flavobacterium sp.]|nr:M12 family metallo-peptidase [Flavobacterium sp.]
MKKNYLIAFFTILLFNQFSFAQSINNWQIKNESESSRTTSKPERKIIPNKYKVFSLDFKSLKTNFKSASKRDTNNKLVTTLLLDFPLDNGTTESFMIEKTSVLHPDLEAKYPEIQSFYGVSKKNPLNKIYISMSPEGFTGVITGEKTIYIDPYSKNDVNNYIVYDRTDYERSPNDSFVCHTEMDKDVTKTSSSTAKSNNAIDSKLRTYDLAVACTSEYTAYYGNTIAGALAAINTTITRVNSVYRRDLGIQFQVVASNDRLIYKDNVNIDTTPDADPYDNYDGGQMLGINTSNITGLITAVAYDIGHVFSTGGGGVANLSVPCVASTKGNGVTGIVTPQYDPFDIDYVCHEIGHQFGAGHTQNNPCQIATVSAMEPGSGSTIMGYAGICPPNIQNNSDAYFHAISIQQITATMNSNTCETETIIANNEPVITSALDYTIPKSTPFIITGIASDPGDMMTYCWEQMNNGTSNGTMPPVSTSTNRPTFRSFFPTTDPSRTFPNLNAIINNTIPTWEVLPSVTRTLNFRLTVRDNNSLGGQSNQDNVIVNVNGTVGPFLVTIPNVATTWYVGESQTVTWDVAGTGVSPYSVNVNIKLSTDGGLTYPITLLSNTLNDGAQAITVPNNIGTNNRIKVEAATNIFFDISNANFEIKSNKFDLTATQSTVSVCKPNAAVYTINYVPAPGFTESVAFSAVGLPSGATAVFSPTSITTAGSVTMTISNISTVVVGNHDFNFNGTSITANINLPITLKVSDTNIGNVTLTSPINGAKNQQTSVLLQWNNLTNASSYTVEIASNPNFSALIETVTVVGNSYQTTSLTTGTINYWRVKPINPCLTGAYSETFVFQIASDFCKTYTNKYFEGNAVWETITTNAVIAKMDIPDNIVISKASFYMKATHTSLADIKMQFSGPTGIFVEVYNRDCTGANFDVTFDDAGTILTCGTNPGMGGIQQASQPLAKFNGSNSLGTWTLLATDRGANTFGGTFTDFNVTICGKLQIVNNITSVKNAFNLYKGNTAVISQTKLETTQPSATSSQLFYIVSQLPTNGTLKLNNVVLTVGETFTQTDINNNLLSYTNNGVNTNPDSFKYSVTGINGALLGGEIFNITICTSPVPNIATLPTVTAECSATVVAPTALSNCLGTIIGTPSVIFPITAQGTTVITWTFDGGNGNITTQEQTVILDDVTAPLIPVLANITGQCGVTPISPTTTDACKGTITGTTSTIFPVSTPGTTVVTWTFNDGNGQSITANQNIIIGLTTWNGTAWSNGIPTANLSVIISGNYNAPTDLTACNLTVNNNAAVTVNSGINFNIIGDVTVSTGSSLTFANNTNLVQTKNTNGNTGNIIVKRQTSALKLLDYVLWSSPVTGQQLQSFSPSTLSNRFYTYNPSTNLYNGIVSTNNFALGTGYLIRMPNNHPTAATIWEGQFEGIPNNGNYNLTVTSNTYNAIGNPYPSSLNANTFMTTNGITEALYFWRKTNNTLTSSYATY